MSRQRLEGEVEVKKAEVASLQLQLSAANRSEQVCCVAFQGSGSEDTQMPLGVRSCFDPLLRLFCGGGLRSVSVSCFLAGEYD